MLVLRLRRVRGADIDQAERSARASSAQRREIVVSMDKVPQGRRPGWNERRINA
jgi:hypothetical protein